MANNRSTSPQAGAQTMEAQKPDPALKRLEKLLGTWELKGRTLGAREDNIRGWTSIEWLPGGFFLQLRGELEFMGDRIQSLELIGYDPATKSFPAWVYSNLDGQPLPYY